MVLGLSRPRYRNCMTWRRSLAATAALLQPFVSGLPPGSLVRRRIVCFADEVTWLRLRRFGTLSSAREFGPVRTGFPESKSLDLPN